MIIKKYYIDGEIPYYGDKIYNKKENWYRDWSNFKFDRYGGIFGVLCIEIDIEKRITREIYFKQHINNKDLDKLDIFNNEGMIVTWNGRSFDIPILYYNFRNRRDEILKKIFRTDRDLLDHCVKKGIKIKGGLGNVIRNLGLIGKLDEPVLIRGKSYNPLNVFPPSFELDNGSRIKIGSLEYDEIFAEYSKEDWFGEYYEGVKTRNEFDCRSLVVLEEYLGLLYNGPIEEDLYHKNWNAEDIKIRELIERSRKI